MYVFSTPLNGNTCLGSAMKHNVFMYCSPHIPEYTVYSINETILFAENTEERLKYFFQNIFVTKLSWIECDNFSLVSIYQYSIDILQRISLFSRPSPRWLESEINMELMVFVEHVWKHFSLSVVHDLDYDTPDEIALQSNALYSFEHFTLPAIVLQLIIMNCDVRVWGTRHVSLMKNQ